MKTSQKMYENRKRVLENRLDELEELLGKVAGQRKPENDPAVEPVWERFEEIREMVNFSGDSAARSGTCPACEDGQLELDPDFIDIGAPNDPTEVHLQCKECGAEFTEWFVFIGRTGSPRRP